MLSKKRCHLRFRFGFFRTALTLFVALLVAAVDVGAAEVAGTVIADGIGISEEAAMNQAYRNAIRQVVGALVISEVITENDELIRDSILSHSDGYVTSFRKIGATRMHEGGLFEVTIAATVSVSGLKGRLASQNISVIETPVDLSNSFAEHETKVESSKSRAAMVADHFREFLPGLVTTFAGTPRLNPNHTEEIIVPLTIELNHEAYRDFYRSLHALMTKLNVQSLTAEETIKLGHPFGSGLVRNDVPRKALRISFDNILKWLKDNRVSNSYFLDVCEQFGVDSKRSRWRVYLVDREILEKCIEHIGFVFVRVDALDADGDIITSKEISLHSGEWGSKPGLLKSVGNGSRARHYPIFGWSLSDKGGDIVLVPRLDPDFYFEAGGASFSSKLPIFGFGTVDGDKMTRDVEFLLSKSEAQQFKRVRCTVFARPVNQ